MKNLKPIQEIYLLALWISVQIIFGTWLKRNFIPESWDKQFYMIVFVFVCAQVLSILVYVINKYEDKL